MALIVEDGTGLANAESYISVADADTYHTDRSNAAWALLTTAAKESALRDATEYIDSYYQFGGYRKTDTQALDWPRFECPKQDVSALALVYWLDTVLPRPLVRACAELALTASSQDLTPDIDRLTSREKLGPLEVEYSDAAAQYKKFRKIDLLLSELIVSSCSSSSVKLNRV
jgi:hypothetical protein